MPGGVGGGDCGLVSLVDEEGDRAGGMSKMIRLSIQIYLAQCSHQEKLLTIDKQYCHECRDWMRVEPVDTIVVTMKDGQLWIEYPARLRL